MPESAEKCPNVGKYASISMSNVVNMAEYA